MDSPEKLSIKELREKAQGTAPEVGRDPIIGLSIRFFSIYFTKVLLMMSINAFQVTVISVLLFLLGSGLFAFGNFWLNIVGVLIIYISIIFDGCNGEVARLKKHRPDIGSIYIEPVSHDIQYGLTFLPLVYGVYSETHSVLIVFVGFIGSVAKLIQRFIMTRYTSLILSEKSTLNTEGEAVIPFNPNVSLPHKIYRFLNRNIFSSVGMVGPLLFFSIIQRVDLFIWVFSSAYCAFALMHLIKELQYIIKIDKPGQV